MNLQNNLALIKSLENFSITKKEGGGFLVKHKNGNVMALILNNQATYFVANKESTEEGFSEINAGELKELKRVCHNLTKG